MEGPLTPRDNGLFGPTRLRGDTANGRQLTISGILLAIFVLVVLLTWQAWQSFRDGEAVARKSLRSRAEFAAASYRSQLEAQLYIAATAEFRATTAIRGARNPIDPVVLRSTFLEALSCHCVTTIPSHTFFRVELSTGKTAIAFGDSLAAPLRPLVARLITSDAASRYRPDWQFAVFTHQAKEPLGVIFYTLVRARDGHPLYAYGFTADTSALRTAIFERSLRYADLVPTTAEMSAPVNTMFSVGVRGSHGERLYQSKPIYISPDSATMQTAHFFGPMIVEVSLNPAVTIPTLTPPMNRFSFPLLILLAVLTTLLLATGLVLSLRAAELSRLRTDFTSSVSHELRTPLTQMLLYSETLALGRTRTMSEAQEIGGVVARETHRLIQIVENTLQFERSERRLLGLAPRTQAVAPVVRQAVDEFKILLPASGVFLEMDLDDSVEATFDADSLRQILFNLLDNAVRYGPTRQVVRVELRAQGDFARLSVSDEGQGIAERDRNRVWRPFVRLDAAAKAGTTGTGIGLAIVRRLAVLQGGRVGIDDHASGSRFFVDLPRSLRESSVGDVKPPGSS